MAEEPREAEAERALFPLEAPPVFVYPQLRAAMARASAPPRTPGRGILLGAPVIMVAALAIDAWLRQRTLLREDASRALALVIPCALAALALALGCSVVAASRGRDGLGQRVERLRVVTFSMAPLSLVPMLAVVWTATPEARALAEPLHPWGLPCIVIASVIATGSLFTLVYVLRHSAPVAVAWRSAALASAAGAWSGFALMIHCSSLELTHVLLGHWLPIALFPLLGAFVARRHMQL